jgi:hypothetical protein
MPTRLDGPVPTVAGTPGRPAAASASRFRVALKHVWFRVAGSLSAIAGVRGDIPNRCARLRVSLGGVAGGVTRSRYPLKAGTERSSLAHWRE